MADIFISYAREDIDKARAIAKELEARGWSVFWDRRIPYGRDFGAYLQLQLDSAQCIVVLWSKASIASQFVRDEAAEGFNGRLVPVLIEAVRQPLGFRQLQAADLTTWTSQVEHEDFVRLVASIESIAPLAPAIVEPSGPLTSTTPERSTAAATLESAQKSDEVTVEPTLRPTDLYLSDLEAHEGPFVTSTDATRTTYTDTNRSEATVQRQPEAPRSEIAYDAAGATSAAPKGTLVNASVMDESEVPGVPAETATSFPAPHTNDANTGAAFDSRHFQLKIIFTIIGLGFCVVVAFLPFWGGQKDETLLKPDDVKRPDATSLDLKPADLNTKCEKGDAMACRALAENYAQGQDGHPNDPERARAFYQKACDGGLPEICNRLGIMYDRGQGGVLVDKSRARELYAKACDGGVAVGCSNLGFLYARGEGGLTVDINRARELYTKACDNGSSLGCNNIGDLYERGLAGLPVDMNRARELYKKSCDGGSPLGCNNLGVMYDRGQGGVLVDKSRARELYAKACDGGVAVGCSNLGVFYARGDGGLAVDMNRAKELYTKACDNGSSLGCSNLGGLYERGQGGLLVDMNKARELYKKSCEGGSPVGCANLKLIAK